ncbi:hypothetical protein Aple_025370 [Acrocarpospora pleiomorpha]|uniref:Knr4/Smi1-like domain-containing protein n=1 Tax=Acrocarpospora pleiomorpha TaxID=90975 RepID=A0A5M3XIY2_9ACTN|nr:hypothetical protein [Acrocarpospora pleiomorpha]GES19641.1 hypothetical protein Aple_025370 [Acrocarpospora pleiomorpha]
MARIAELFVMIGSPFRQPSPVDWAEIESDVGLEFPDDYKQWQARYPDVQVDEFLYIYHLKRGEDLSVREQALRTLRSLRHLGTKRDFIWMRDEDGGSRRARPFPIYPDRGGVYPWGATDNGDKLLWLTDPDPEKWTVVITNGGDWWHYQGSFSEFLVGTLTREVVCPIFPDDFPESANIDELDDEE